MFDDLAEMWVFRQKAKIVLSIFGLFFLSMFMSCQELRYMVSGKTIDASANTRLEYFERDGQKYVHRILHYTYMDGTETRQQYIDVPMDMTLNDQSTLKIQYIPGRDLSRINGHTDRVWVYVFFTSLAAAVAGAFVMVKYG